MNEFKKSSTTSEAKRENIFKWLLTTEFFFAIIVLVVAGLGYIFLK